MSVHNGERTRRDHRTGPRGAACHAGRRGEPSHRASYPADPLAGALDPITLLDPVRTVSLTQEPSEGDEVVFALNLDGAVVSVVLPDASPAIEETDAVSFRVSAGPSPRLTGSKGELGEGVEYRSAQTSSGEGPEMLNSEHVSTGWLVR